MQQSNNAIPIKIVVVGDGSVGKTCMLLSYTTDQFPTKYIPTIFENYSAQIMVDDSMINLALWDTAGQEEYNKLRKISYPQTDLFIIVFSIDDRISLNNAIKKWYKELCELAPHTPKLFVGNKIDLRNEQSNNKKYVQAQIANQLIKELQCDYMECSAMTRQGLKQIFDQAIRTALKKRQQSIVIRPFRLKQEQQSEDNSDMSTRKCQIM